jgi:hypothetical protein
MSHPTSAPPPVRTPEQSNPPRLPLRTSAKSDSDRTPAISFLAAIHLQTDPALATQLSGAIPFKTLLSASLFMGQAW